MANIPPLALLMPSEHAREYTMRTGPSERTTSITRRSLPMLSGHEKINIGVFAKRFEKIHKILLALKQKQTTAQLTVQHLTDIESACRGIKLLTAWQLTGVRLYR